jgi:hypothetical protein
MTRHDATHYDIKFEIFMVLNIINMVSGLRLLSLQLSVVCRLHSIVTLKTTLRIQSHVSLKLSIT